MAEQEFKARWNEHNFHFNHENYKTSSELAEYVWKLKNDGISYTIKWTIIKKLPSCNKGNYFALYVQRKRDKFYSPIQIQPSTRRTSLYQNAGISINSPFTDINTIKLLIYLSIP